MKYYSYSEIGMLIGAGVGGALSIAAFALWENISLFLLAVLGIIIGTYVGSRFDRRHKNHESEKHSENTGIFFNK